MDKKEILEYLNGLPSVDLSEMEFEEEERIGEYNRIDVSYAEGKRLYIKSLFTNLLDIHRGEFDEVVLVGDFNIVDLSKAKIKVLNKEKAKILILDTWKAKIGKTQN